MVALDGVFLREGEKRALVFHEGPAPSREAIVMIAERVGITTSEVFANDACGDIG